MKQILLSVMLALNTISSTFIPFHPTTDATDIFLIPYLQTIDKVNLETGSTFSLPPENKAQAFAFLQNYTPEEYEDYLKKIYHDYCENCSFADSNYTCTDNPINNKILKTIYYEDYGQAICIEKYQTKVRLFTRLKGSGTPFRYKYLSVNRVTTSYPSSYTGLHFEPLGNTISAIISADGESCTVTISGYPQDASGVSLTILQTFTLIYYAN